MPKKTNKGRARSQFSLQDLEYAAEQVHNGISQRQASKLSGIPRGIINRFLVKGAGGLGAGRPAVFGKEVEDKLVKCVLARAEMGYPCTKKELLNLVQEYVVRNKIATPFINGKPGKDWYGGFMRRHREISLKTPETLQKARVKARDPFVVYSFYDQLKAVYDECLPPARLIYNADESGFGMDPRSVRALGRRGELLHQVTGVAAEKIRQYSLAYLQMGKHFRHSSCTQDRQCSLGGWPRIPTQE